MNPIDNLNTALTGTALPNSVSKDASQAQKEQFAKDFESVFLEKLMDEMKNTIGNWGFEEDGASQQIQGLFWMNLARDVSDKGGMGMWKEIYQSLNTTEDNTAGTQSIDNQL